MHRIVRLPLLLSFLASTAACASMPVDLDMTLEHASDHRVFVVALEPPATPPKVNKIHAWRVHLTDINGAPVRNARIAVDGGMPQHGHGLPTQPRVTRELEAGTYLLEGMKFSMTGWWEIRLKVDAPLASDTVTFNTVLGATQ